MTKIIFKEEGYFVLDDDKDTNYQYVILNDCGASSCSSSSHCMY